MNRILIMCVLAALLSCSVHRPNTTVIIPNNYQGICFIGFSGFKQSNTKTLLELNKMGVVKFDATFSDFNKGNSFHFKMYDSNRLATIPLSEYDPNTCEKDKLYYQQGMSINTNGHDHIMFLIGDSSFLNKEFRLEDPEVDVKLNSFKWE
jgi:hypothetical protein